MSLKEIGYQPLLPPPEKKVEKPRDWLKITAIAAAVISGLVIGLGMLCVMGMLPPDLLGGSIGMYATIAAGGLIFIPSVYVVYKRWNN